MAGIKNIIRKQTVHFHYHGQVDGFALQKEVYDWCSHTLIPQLERLLEPYCMPHLHMVLDKLELAATIDGANWQEQIQQQVITALQTELAQQAIELAATDRLFTATVAGATHNLAPATSDRQSAVEGKKEPQSPMSALDTGDGEAANHGPAASEKATEKQMAAANASMAKKQTALVLFFLQHGYLPWWSNTVLAEPFAQWLPQWLLGNLPSDTGQGHHVQARVQQLVQQIKNLALDTATHRLVQHLPSEQFAAFVQLAFPQAVAELDQIRQLLSAFPTLVANRTKYQQLLAQIQPSWLAEKIQPTLAPGTPIWAGPLYQAIQPTPQGNKKTGTPATAPAIELPATLLANNPLAQQWQQWVLQKQAISSLGQPPTGPQARQASEKPQPNGDTAATKDKKTTETNAAKSTAPKPKAAAVEAEWQEGIFIENAGAVIVAPFLPMLFNTLQLTKNGMMWKPAKAAWLIQYLVTGNTAIGEADLVLPKILCGMDPDELVNPRQKITALQKKEAQELLASVITHWSILKSTSPAGLQQSFLQRHGKLIHTNEHWLLQVEQKSFDMLLQQLPWNISMIKLPWMKNVLITEWV